MPLLPPVTQDFGIEAAGYLAGIAAMIEATDRLASAISDVTGAAASAASRAAMSAGGGFDAMAASLDSIQVYSHQTALALEDVNQHLYDAAQAGPAAAAGLAATGTAAAGMAGRMGILAGGLFTFGNVVTVTHLALAFLGSQVAADTIGIAAFGLAATHAISPAVTAASSVANLTTQYAALDPYQQAAALSLKSFTDGLHTADEAGIFGVFYQGLSLVQQGMGHTGGIVTQAANAVSDFLGMLNADLGSSSWVRLLGGQTGLIRTDMDALFGLINSGINVIPALFHNFNFLGVAVVNTASAFLRGVSAVAEWNPALTRAIALAGVAYGAYKVLWAGLGAGPGPLARLVTGVTAFGTRVATASSYMSEGAAVAASYAGPTALGAITGVGLAATAAVSGLVIGLGALIYYEARSRDATVLQIAALRQADNAVGNNVAGYQAMNVTLGQNIKAITGSSQALTTMANVQSRFAGPSATSAGVSVGELTSALQANQQVIGAVRSNAALLGGTLGLTRSQVIAFAAATGVNLTTALSASGAQFIIDAGKIKGYAAAVGLSHHPLSQFMADAQQASDSANSLTDQVKALTAAYAALVTPTLNVIQGAITQKNDQLAAAAAIRAASGAVGIHTAAQRAAGLAIVQAANDALTQSANIKTMTGSTQKAVGPLQNFVSWMESTGAKGSYVAEILRRIKQAEDALYNKTITVTTIMATAGGGTPAGTPGGGHVQGPGGGSPQTSSAAAFAAGGAGQYAPVTGNIVLAGQGMHAAGQALILGLPSGMESNLRGLWSSVTSIGAGIAGTFRSVMGIFSPSKVMARLGLLVGQGIIAGLEGSAAQVRSASSKLATAVREALRAGLVSYDAAADLTAFIERDNLRLQADATRRASILKTIATAQKYAVSTAQSVTSWAGLSNVVSGMPAGSVITSQGLEAGLQADLAKIRRFNEDIRKLSRLGLNHDLLNQIIQAGPDAGMQLAEALLNGPVSEIAKLNKTETAITGGARALGREAANAMYDAGKYAGHGFLSGLEHQQKAIEALMERIAKAMVDKIRHELGIHSASTVAHYHGLMFAQGLADGMTAGLPLVDTAAKRLAGAAGFALGGRGTGGSSGGEVHIDNRVMVSVTVPGGFVGSDAQLSTVLSLAIQKAMLQHQGRNPTAQYPTSRSPRR